MPPVVAFRLAPPAEQIEAPDWYAARNAELADRFIAEVENVVVRIAAARMLLLRPRSVRA